MKTFLRHTTAFVVVMMLLSGCKTVIKINNRTDPKDFDPIALGTSESRKFSKEKVEVPEEISNEEFEITRVDIFGQVTIEYPLSQYANPLTVDLYIGLDSLDQDLDDLGKNELIASELLDTEGKIYPIEVHSPSLATRALRSDAFYFKAIVRSSAPTVCITYVERVYLDASLERETEGLFPFFYLF